MSHTKDFNMNRQDLFSDVNLIPYLIVHVFVALERTDGYDVALSER